MRGAAGGGTETAAPHELSELHSCVRTAAVGVEQKGPRHLHGSARRVVELLSLYAVRYAVGALPLRCRFESGNEASTPSS